LDFVSFLFWFAETLPISTASRQVGESPEILMWGKLRGNQIT